jgi:phage-related protein
MPQTAILVYCPCRGVCQLESQLDDLKKKDKRAYAQCLDRIRRLSREGYELRRPVADYLRDGIYELRSRVGNVHHRILYFFTEARNAAVLSHHVTKESKVSPKDINEAVHRKMLFLKSPLGHTAEFDVMLRVTRDG